MRHDPYFGSVVQESGLAGWGSFTKSVRKVVKAPAKVIRKTVGKPIAKILPKPLRKAIAVPGKLWNKGVKGVSTVGKMAGAIVGIKPKAGGGGAEEVYTDADGKPISKAEYDKLMAAGGGDGEPVYQDENGKPITKAEYDRRMAELNAGGDEQAYADENGKPITKAEYEARMAALTAAPPTTAPPSLPQPSEEPPPAGSEGPVAVATAAPAPAPRPQAQSYNAAADTGEAGPAEESGGTEEAAAPATPPTVVAQAEQEVPVFAPAMPAPRRINKGLAIGGIVAGVAVLGLVIFLATRKKG